MKQRFSSLDVRVIALELHQQLLSLRLSNVYDLSSRIFLLKFAKPEHRQQLIVESGFRCHLTDFARVTAAAPSTFVSRLRKFLRTRRVTAVSQVGTDRVIDIQFSDGQYHLLLEFYAGGNVVLTDNDFNVLALLRTVNEGDAHEQYRVGVKYDISQRQNYAGVPSLTQERVRAGLELAVQRKQDAEAQGKKSKKKSGDALRKALAVTTTEFAPTLIDHALRKTGFDKDTLPSQILQDQGLMDRLMTVFVEANNVLGQVKTADPVKGYILAKRNAAKDHQSQDATHQDTKHGLIYDDFHAFRPCQFEDLEDIVILEHDGFNKTVDEFYSSIEGQKLEGRLQERQDNAKRKIAHAKSEHEKRIDSLQQVQELNVQKAQAIEANLDRVEEATAAINGLIAQGMDWHEAGRLIEMEQARHNPVAATIKLPLKLHENTATLLLATWDAQDDDEMAEETDSEPSDTEDQPTTSTSHSHDRMLTVDIDLSLSAWSNARQYYENKKVAATKQDKTLQASAKALKSTETRINADLKKGLKQEKQLLTAVRRQMWFEKFIYFISSDGYLVLAGKDAQQCDILYNRHFNNGDIYISADLNGATSVIVQNNPATPDAPIPPSTLSQAGSLAVCTSTAWESKAVMSAWWVDIKQVSKTAPTGEYLAVGAFNVSGKKNYLPPAQLLLGFAVAFQVSEDSKARHLKHRFKEPVTANAADTAAVDHDAAQDSDDEFPDAVGPGKHSHDDDDSDDEFPDASSNRHADDSGSEEDSRSVSRPNPLQPRGIEELRGLACKGSKSDSDESVDGEFSDRSVGDLDDKPQSATSVWSASSTIPDLNSATPSGANAHLEDIRGLSKGGPKSDSTASVEGSTSSRLLTPDQPRLSVVSNVPSVKSPLSAVSTIPDLDSATPSAINAHLEDLRGLSRKGPKSDSTASVEGSTSSRRLTPDATPMSATSTLPSGQNSASTARGEDDLASRLEMAQLEKLRGLSHNGPKSDSTASVDGSLSDGTAEITSGDTGPATNVQALDLDKAAHESMPRINTNATSNQPSKKGSTTLPRGKRGKAKKAAAKYAEQDEEERKVALALLGAKPKDTANTAADAERNETAARSAAESSEAQRARRRAQHDLSQSKGLEEEARRRKRLADNTRLDNEHDDDDEHEQQADHGNDAPNTEDVTQDTTSAVQIDSFVGTPLPDDEILEAIPICAPWSALAKYKYKAKLQPGVQKKGKAVREVLGRWLKDAANTDNSRRVDMSSRDTERIWPREAELLRGWREAEIVGVVPVKSVRLVVSGGAAGAGAGGDKKKAGGGKGKRGGRGSKRK